MWTTTLSIAITAIRRNLMRSILTVLGVIIGVWSVVTMVTLGNATSLAITNSISSLGSSTLTLLPGAGFGRGGGGPSARNFSFDDVEALQAQIGGVNAVAPQVSAQRTVVFNAANWRTTVTGTTDAYLTSQNWTVAQGRGFSREEEDSGKSVCLLGATVIEKLFGSAPALNATVRAGDVSCVVIGELSQRGQGVGNNPDDSVLMPIRLVQRRITGNRDISAILVSHDPARDALRVKAEITTLMRDRRGLDATEDNDFNLIDARQILSTLTTATRLLTTLLAAVAAVSLLVGGIGIMNIMLVSVTERTREIGIRLAIGALAENVLQQFLVESMALSCFGGVLGLLLANLTTAVVSPVLGVPFRFELGINALAFTLSAGIGVMFGYFPARRAAALNPIEALRFE